MEAIIGILVSIISGAGGAALLELWWKPYKLKKQVASVLLAEILLNTDFLLTQAHYREKRPEIIPLDSWIHTLAFDKLDNLYLLDINLIKRILLLFSHYNSLNNYVKAYKEIIDNYESLPESDPSKKDVQRELHSIVHIFHLLTDDCIEKGKSISEQLLPIAKVKSSPEEEQENRNYKAAIEKHLDLMEKGVKHLDEIDKQN